MLDVAARPATKVHTNRGRQQRLVRIISELSLLRSGQIRLAAGGTSTFYFDMKPTLFCPEGAALVAERVLDFAAQEDAQLVGGLEIGAVPIVACVSQLSFFRGRPRVQGFFVRKAPKDHGTRKRIEGLLPEVLRGSRALIVDDVTTTGSSILQAVDAARAEGAIIGTVLTVVDRLEGAATNLAKHGVNLVPLTTAADYGLWGLVLPALVALEGEYLASLAAGAFGSAQLFQLGARAGDLFAASLGPHSLLAYVLHSIFLDLAQRMEGEPVSVELANAVFDALSGPVEASINGLKAPMTEEMAAQLAMRLLEAPRLFTPSAQTHWQRP